MTESFKTFSSYDISCVQTQGLTLTLTLIPVLNSGPNFTSTQCHACARIMENISRIKSSISIGTLKHLCWYILKSELSQHGQRRDQGGPPPPTPETNVYRCPSMCREHVQAANKNKQWKLFLAFIIYILQGRFY